MTKIDFKKTLKHLYQPSDKAPVIVDGPAMNFLMIDGHGDPNTTPFFAEAPEALYARAYSIRFAIKKAQNIEYAPPPGRSLVDGRHGHLQCFAQIRLVVDLDDYAAGFCQPTNG